MACTAFCIEESSSLNYEIITASGPRSITSKCTNNRVLIGCGFHKLEYFSSATGYWYVYPKNSQECVCNTNSNIICFAVCVDIYGFLDQYCENCIPNYCTSTGCQKCEPEFYLKERICVNKPCYNICPNCTSQKDCKICESCNQNTNFTNTTCTDSSVISQGCLPCPPNFYLTKEGYCTKCSNTTDPHNYRLISNSGIRMCFPCSEAIKNCNICSSNPLTLQSPKCLKCEDGFYFDEIGNCVECVESTLFNDGSGKCYKKPCFNICPDCTTESQCEICSECSQCNDSNCQTCLNRSLVQLGCLPCKPQFYLNSEGFCESCIYEEHQIKYKSGNDNGTGLCNECSKAFPYCLLCDTDKCLKCQDNYNLDDFNNCSSCNSSEYFEKTIDNIPRCFKKPCYSKCPQCLEDQECEICESCTQCTDFGCMTCLDPNLIKFGCLPCQKDYYLMPEGYCSHCDGFTHSYYFFNGSSNGTGLCSKCEEEYPFCSMCDSISCLNCSAGYYLQENKECSLCINDEYYKKDSDTDLCVKKPCYSICPKCISDEECEICKECNQCIYNDCQTCTDPQLISKGCLPCPKDYYLNEIGFCSTCDEPYSFIKGEKNGSGLCINCSFYSSNCEKCNNVSCISCKENYIMDINKLCTTCVGKYIYTERDGNKTCRTCSDFLPDCARCEGNICFQCELGFYLDENNKCVKCKDLREYNPFLDRTYELCSRCSQIMQDCFSCNLTHCHQCNENTYHKTSSKCLPCDDSQQNHNPCFDCSTIIDNCVLCEVLDSKVICLKCDEEYYLTNQGLCSKCLSTLDLYIYENKYCFPHTNPINHDSLESEISEPTDKIYENNMEMWVFKEVCLPTLSNTTYVNEEIFVYWMAYPSVSNQTNETFEFIKNKSILLDGLINYDDFFIYGYGKNNQIIINLPDNIHFKVVYYCEKPFNHVNIYNKGEFYTKRQFANISYYIMMQFQSEDLNISMKSDRSLVCILEKLLEIEEKKLLTTVNGIIFYVIIYFFFKKRGRLY